MLEIALAAALSTSAPAVVEVPQASASEPTLKLNASQLFVLAERAETTGKVAVAEQAYEALAQDPNKDVRAEALLRHGLLLAKDGRLEQAAILLRRLLELQPRSQGARLQLAAILTQLGDEQGARSELRLVRVSELPPEIARMVDRWSETLRSRKPWGLSFEVALAPDSNINRATTLDSLDTVLGDFDIDEDGKARSGVGVAMRASTYRRLALTDALDLRAQLSTSADLYRDKEFNFTSVEAVVGPEFSLVGSRVSIQAAAGQSWFGGAKAGRQLRLAALARRPLGSRTNVAIRASATSVDNHLNALQSGRGASAGLSVEQALGGNAGLLANATVERFRARDPGYSTRSWRFALHGWRDLGRSTLFAGAETGKLQGDEALLLLPAARSDRYSRFSAGAVLRSLSTAGMAPFIRLSREKNRSNIAFYDYARTRTEFGISRAF